MSDYQILPFRFTRFNDSEYLLTNDVGEYIFLRNEDFEKFIKKELDVKEGTEKPLKIGRLLDY